MEEAISQILTVREVRIRITRRSPSRIITIIILLRFERPIRGQRRQAPTDMEEAIRLVRY